MPSSATSSDDRRTSAFSDLSDEVSATDGEHDANSKAEEEVSEAEREEDNDNDVDGEEDEEEEEEVEEEVEVEEEEEEEVEEEEEEIGADSLGSPAADANDVSEDDVESEGHEEKHVKPGSTPDNSEARLLSNNLSGKEDENLLSVSGPSNGQPTKPMEESYVKDEGSKSVTLEDKGIQMETPTSKIDNMDQDNAELSTDTVKETAILTPMRGGLSKVANGILSPNEENTQMEKSESRLPSPGTRTRSLTPGAESNDRNKRAAVMCEFFARGWCIKGSSCRFLHKKDDLGATSADQKDEHKPDEGFSNDVGKENHASPIAKGSSPLLRNNVFPEYGSLTSSSVISPHTYGTSGLPSYSTSFDELSIKYMPNAHLRPPSFSRSASLLWSSSPFSSSEHEKFSLTNLPWDPPHSSAYKTTFSPTDWEPSVPFRPSFFLTQMLSSSGTQYDPLRDSIEQPNTGDSFKPSFYGQGSSVVSISNQQINGDPVSTESGFLLGKEHDTHGKDLTSEDPVETAVGEPTNEITLEKERDNTKANQIVTDRDPRHLSGGARQKKDIKVDRVRQYSEGDIVGKTDGEEAPKESKVQKQFRTALVDLVKDLVKPIWREGQLSKDAHKMIVKKSVDKVLSTLHPHQIPSTMESINQYLSSFQPKISKLVEGYAEKYAKS